MSRASRLSGFTTAISGDTDLNVGIVTAKQLNVNQSFTFTDINVTGVATANNLNVTGVSTLGNVVVGGATTDLVVNGNARVTGILTVGTSSLTLNGDSSTISGITTINSVTIPAAGGLTNRNIVINGAMQVAQRGTSVTSINNTATTYATIDRMYHAFNSYGAWTSTQESDGPDGFTKSWKMNCTTANSSLSAGDYALLVYRVEAQDCQHLKYGTSSAEDTVFSFWVKSNKTGAASFEIAQLDNSSKQFCTSYTINTADTWEYKTITIPGDTAGVIDDNNGPGIQIGWWLGSGSQYSGGTHATTWEASTDVNRNASDLACGMTLGDYFQITGIQWELGTQATSFEHRSYGDELQRCRRYFQHFTCGGSGTATGSNQTQSAQCTVNFTPEMRAQPTITFGAIGGSTNTTGSPSSFVLQKQGFVAGAASAASGRQFWVVGLSTASAEL